MSDAEQEVVIKQNKEIDALKNQVENLEQRQKVLETEQKNSPAKPADNFPPKGAKSETPKKVEEPIKRDNPVVSNEAEEYGEFLLIAGAYSDQTNAMNFIKYLKGKGKQGSYYFDENSKLHYVYIGKHTMKSKAIESKNALAASGIQTWVKNIKK